VSDHLGQANPPSHVRTRLQKTAPQPTSLSAGSAASTLIALLLGLLAQPEGSLCLPEEENVASEWRFSPLLSLLKYMTILLFLVVLLILIVCSKVPSRC
jgi:hypothetical protein